MFIISYTYIHISDKLTIKIISHQIRFLCKTRTYLKLYKLAYLVFIFVYSHTIHSVV